MTSEYPGVEHLLDALPVCIAYVDADARYRVVNATYERWFRLPAAQVIGRTVRDVLGEAAHARVRPHVEAVLAGERRDFEDELPYARGGTRFVSASYVPDHGPDGRVAGFYAVISDISDRKRLEREVAKAAVEEQQRIGRELHDSLGQQLTAVELFAETLRLRLVAGDVPQARDAQRIVDLARRAHRGLGDLARGLVPVEIEAGALASALDALAWELDQADGLRCRYRSAAPVVVPDNLVATYLFRIAQEALANAVRHAEARNLTLELHADESGELILQVVDDGRGIDPGAVREVRPPPG